MSLIYFQKTLRTQFISVWAAIVFVAMLTATMVLPFYVAQWPYIFNFINFVNEYGYSLIVLALLSGIGGVFAAQKVRALDYDNYLVGYKTAIVSHLAVMFLLLFATNLIPILLTAIMNIFYPTLSVLWFSGMAKIMIQSTATILFSMFFGYFIGSRVKHKASYLLVLLFSILQAPVLSGSYWATDTKWGFILQMLNTTHLHTGYNQYETYGVLFGTRFWWHKLFVLACSALFVFFAKTNQRRKSTQKIRLTATLLAAVIVLCSVVAYGHNIPTNPFISILINAMERVYLPDSKQSEHIQIQEYRMSLDIRRKFHNSATIIFETSLPEISFWLDEGFTVEHIALNGKNVEPRWKDDLLDSLALLNKEEQKMVKAYYGQLLERRGDTAIITLPSSGKQVLEIDYGGSIFYETNMRNKTFMGPKAGGFDMLFAWYPKLCEVANPIPFNISVVSDNNYISNFTNHEVVKTREKTTFIGDFTPNLFLLKGYIDTIPVDGIKMTVPAQLAINQNKLKTKQFLSDLRAECSAYSFGVTPETVASTTLRRELSVIIRRNLSVEKKSLLFKGFWDRMMGNPVEAPEPIKHIIITPPFYNSIFVDYLSEGRVPMIREDMLNTKF